MKQDQIEKHSTTRSVFLHLLPGILVGCFYFLALKPVANMGYPSFFAQFLAFAFILVPFELGFLLVQGKKKTGRFTLRGIISYRNPIPWWQYFVWVSIIFVIVGAIMTLFKPVDSFLQKNLFFLDAGCKYWIGWYLFQNNIDHYIFGVLNNQCVFSSNR